MESKYKYAEAYCLMKYKCEKCDRHMQHTDWNEDKRIINYIPKIGQRVFIDMPFDYYKIYCRVRAKMIKANMTKIQ